MKAVIPYLARLARQPAGQAMLRPPRQLFTGDIDMPARLPDRGGPARRRPDEVATSLPESPVPAATGEERTAAQAAAAAHRIDIGKEHGTGLEPGSAASAGLAPAPNAMDTPAISAWPQPAAGVLAPPGSPDLHRLPQVAPHRPGPSHSGPPAAGPPGSASTPPHEAPASSNPRPAAGMGPARAQESWASTLWGGPVDLPEAGPVSVAGEAAAPRAVSVWPAEPATSTSGPGTAAHQDGGNNDGGGPEARGAADRRMPGAGGATNLGRGREPAQIQDLMPPPSPPARPVAMPGAGPGEPYRELRFPGRPQVSIGSIEVTVVPPSPAAPAAGGSQTVAPTTRGRPRPPSLLVAGTGRDRLRDGFRRWYGTAQG